MTEQEQIEVWRRHFEKWFDSDVPLKKDKNGSYVYMAAHSSWTAWLAAKQSQPVIELPSVDKIITDYYLTDGKYKSFIDCAFNEFTAAIEHAGYKWKVKA